MSDPTIGKVDLEQIEAEERREKIRNRILLSLILLIGIGVAFWVGGIVTANQSETSKAQAQTEQAQVEKFNLAQQIAVACKEPDGLDAATQARLCSDAATIVREGPRGAQGIPGATGPQGSQGLQGIQGIPGFDGRDGAPGKDGLDGANGKDGAPGIDGKDGTDGAPGRDGVDGKDGAVGPAGANGKDGQSPFSWVVYNENGRVIESCVRADPFDPAAPTYACTRD